MQVARSSRGDTWAPRSGTPRPANKRGNELLDAYNVTPLLGEIRAPTLVLVGHDDVICPPSQAAILQAGIPNAELVVFEGSGHFPFIEEPDRFVGVVRGWLSLVG